MEGEKQAIEFSSEMETQAAASHLEALAKSLREGRLVIESGDRSVSLETGRNVSLELEAKANPEKGKSSIEIKLEWVAEEEVVEEAPPSLLIVSGGSYAAAWAGGDEDSAEEAAPRKSRRK
jgi:amphi-Trp domain-containing protein